jgi:hypothetical protein
MEGWMGFLACSGGVSRIGVSLGGGENTDDDEE